MSSDITLEEIRSAADQIRGHIVETPCVPSRLLSEITGAEVLLKLENLQSTGSFKVRGALSTCGRSWRRWRRSATAPR